MVSADSQRMEILRLVISSRGGQTTADVLVAEAKVLEAYITSGCNPQNEQHSPPQSTT